jgi:membrane-associated phospholipid phosphatase
MKKLLFTLPRNLVNCFKGRMIIWHIVAIISTFILVRSGFDWRYFQATAGLRRWMYPAAFIGFMVPIYLPLAMLAAGGILKNTRCWLAALAVAQAEIIGLVVSSAYKAVTGRAHPLFNGTEDITRQFHFGFLRGGMFWGWPSSHTTIAFAMAITVFRLFPKQRWFGVLAIAYATYIGLGISMTIHWCSDFIAGAIIGTLIGVIVAKGFRDHDESTHITQATKETHLG